MRNISFSLSIPPVSPPTSKLVENPGHEENDGNVDDVHNMVLNINS